MFLGIDGGGTKTAFVLISTDGRELARATGGSAYHPDVGIAGLRTVLEAGVREVLRIAGATVADLRAAFVGLPALGEDPSIDPQLELAPGVVLPADRYRCGNDMVCSWAGSLACEDGISVIAGTGSIAYGEFAGRNARAGGWGDVFGDEGSAYWIAREGLGAFSRMSDGRLPRGPLHELLRQHFRLTHDLDLAGIINQPASAARAALAQLSRIVAAAASAGDAAAGDIYARAGRELAGIVHATRSQLAVPGSQRLSISYSGGVFNTGPLILEPFRAALVSEAYRLQTPRFSPDVGAALLAARSVGVRFDAAQLARLDHAAAHGANQ